jgi:hypothetical protein
METIQVQTNTKDGVLNVTQEVRTGSALPLKEPEKVVINGNIDSISRWLGKRVSEINQKKAHVIVSRDDLALVLTIDEDNFYKSHIQGSLKLSPEVELFEINTGKRISPFDLAEKIKMNRSCFESKEVAMKLVSDLRNFKAKVDKQIEQSKDDRANYNLKKIQAVESNLPEAFDLVIPIFKGQPPVKVTIEVSIDANSLDCSLVSPSVNDIINETRDKLIEAELDLINELAPDIAIIEV